MYNVIYFPQNKAHELQFSWQMLSHKLVFLLLEIVKYQSIAWEQIKPISTTFFLWDELQNVYVKQMFKKW